MKKHSKIIKLTCTISAYTLGFVVSRHLAPPANTMAIAGDAYSSAIARVDETTVALTPQQGNAPASDNSEASNQTDVKDHSADQTSVEEVVKFDTSVASTREPAAEPDQQVELIPAAGPSADRPSVDVGRLAPVSSIVANQVSTKKIVANQVSDTNDNVSTERHTPGQLDPARQKNSNIRNRRRRNRNQQASESDAESRSPAASTLRIIERPAPIENPFADAVESVESKEDIRDPNIGDAADAQEAELPPFTADVTPSLSPQFIALEQKVRQALDIYRDRNMNTRDHGAWAVMHSLIGYGVEKEVLVGGPNGKPVNAIGWICWNGVCRGDRLFYTTNGNINSRIGPGRQGHKGQFLAMLAQSRVKTTYPMRISGNEFTVADLIRSEQATCRPRTELTFKLIGLSHYLDSDESWEDNRGDDWDISRMIKEELRQPIIGAACGGTHRLFGLSYAVNQRRKSGKPLDGEFHRADVFVRDYHDYTFKLQNKDGSTSTSWFAGRGSKRDVARRLQTTGHTAEWLAFSLPLEELHREEMVKLIDYLAGILIDGSSRDWSIGPLGHALHALNIYHGRAFPQTAQPPIVESLTDAD
ncbi:MAG: hypothetical protein VX988_03770 [Planctomycetota bacterium]|nr:hypothetical protein [Planctomycetota bacterium]